METDCIKYAVSRMKDNSKAHDFGISYRRSMEGIDGYPLKTTLREMGKIQSGNHRAIQTKEGSDASQARNG